MNWDRVSWVVVAACAVGAGVLVFDATRPKARPVRLPDPPVEPGTIVTKPIEVTELPPDPPPPPPDGLPEVCKPLLGKVPGFPTDPKKQAEFCIAWAELIAKPSPPPEDIPGCGPRRVMQALIDLDTCAEQYTICEAHGAAALANVDMRDILAAAQEFGLHVEYFDKGSSSVGNPRALRDFVESQLGKDDTGKRSFMIFGSASPTALDQDVDIELARKRTEAAFKVVNGVLTRRKRFLTPSRKANIGRGLSEDVCGAMPSDSAQRKACEALDVNGRRQAAFVLAYPRDCLASRAEGAD
jgi:hypothetical protein